MGLLAAVLSNIAFAFSDSLWTLGLKKLKVLPLIGQRTIFSIAFITIVVALTGSYRQVNLLGVQQTLVIAAFSYGGLYFFVKSMSAEDNRKIVIVISCLTLFSSLCSYFFLNEPWNRNMLLSLTLYLASAILLFPFRDGLRIKLNRGLLYALLAAVIWGFTLPLLSIPAKQMGGVNTSLFTELTVFFCTLLVNLKGLKTSFKEKLKPVSVFLGLAAAVAVICMNLAYELTLAAYVGLIGSMGNLFSQVLIKFIYNKPIEPRYILSGCVAALATILLVIN